MQHSSVGAGHAHSAAQKAKVRERQRVEERWKRRRGTRRISEAYTHYTQKDDQIIDHYHFGHPSSCARMIALAVGALTIDIPYTRESIHSCPYY